MFNGGALNMLFQIFIESEVAQFQNCHFFEYKTKKKRYIPHICENLLL